MLEVPLGILTRTCSRGQCMESWISVLSVIWKRGKNPFYVGAGHKDLGFFILSYQSKTAGFSLIHEISPQESTWISTMENTSCPWRIGMQRHHWIFKIP